MGSSELMNSTDQAGISPPDDIERLTSYRSSSAMIDALRPREPVYCLYTDTLVTEARRFLEGFPGRVLYAVKANPHPAVIAALWDAGVRHFDTASIPEIALVKAVAPEATCYFMAPSRLLGAAAEARFKYGVRHFVVDHPNALELLLEEVGGDKVDDLTIFVRMAAPHGGAMYEFSSKFGAQVEMAAKLLLDVAATGAEPALSFNLGSMVMEPTAFAAGLELANEVLETAGIQPRLVDIGGGFPSDYPGLDTPSLETLFSAIGEARSALSLMPEAELLSEPGRALVAAGVSLVTQVILRKDNELFINDGIYGSLSEPIASDGQVHFPVRTHRADGQGFKAENRPFMLFGPTCDGADALPVPFDLPADIKVGDWIEFGMLGAYSLANRTAFNGFYPEAMVEITGTTTPTDSGG